MAARSSDPNEDEAKYGKLQYRHENEPAKIYPMLERIMDRVNRAIYRRLNPRMSKLHPWLVCFDVGMPREVFDLLYQNILGESCYGIEVKEGPRSVTKWFVKLRRLVVLFDKFVNCEGFEKELKGDKGCVNVVVDGERKGSFEYKIKEEILKVKLHYGYWNNCTNILSPIPFSKLFDKAKNMTTTENIVVQLLVNMIMPHKGESRLAQTSIAWSPK
ncbi:Hypothetical predicted protein [Paramuricea clavata]|uniref:Uncharacterized protein n=1 Tax=Paramuricea clavata TaxID=317549 RepID=A0A7D9DST0_PARCT|nr:Hypothetical predicted protein [Paramuricea clavata]